MLVRKPFNRLLQAPKAFGIVRRWFFSGSVHLIKRNQLPPRPKINEDEIEEVFIKGGGKGGQKINKTNSKVQLKHVPSGIVVSSQYSRSREQNRKRAREILALKVEELAVPEGQSRAAVVAKYKQQKARKKKGRSRKKYQELDAAKKASAAAQQGGSNEEDLWESEEGLEDMVDEEYEQDEEELSGTSEIPASSEPKQ